MRINSKSRLNTIVVFLFSIIFGWFFFYSKHNSFLADVKVFNEDPFDAVGSAGIQVAFFSACISLYRISISYLSQNLNLFLILKGNSVVLVSVEVTMVSNLISLTRFADKWTMKSSGIIFLVMVFTFLILAIILHLWTLSIVKETEIRQKIRFVPFKLIWVVLGFLILIIFPSFLNESVLGAIFTALAGIILQITIAWNLSSLLIPDCTLSSIDLIDDTLSFWTYFKNHFLHDRGAIQKTIITETNFTLPIFNWLNPRKHRFNLILTLCSLGGVLIVLIHAIGEGWSGTNIRSLLVSLIYFGLEFIIILLYFSLFSRYLGLIKKELPY
jgi:hypothetical protein